MNSIVLNKKVLEEMEISGFEFLYLYYIHTEEDFGMNFDEIDVEKIQEKK
jgi:hypothetical protein